ncbi:MAG TPA: diguanylate cyclase, partial [Burkholderiales bacterium]|nr:diguanylate cyclase [Burkholderiales bacterium]
ISTSVPSGLFADWYWEMDGQLRLTHTSEPFTAKTGLDAADDYWEHNRRSLERHEPFRDFEIQRFAPDGRSLWLALSGEPVFDEQDTFRGYHGIGRNITAQKRAEQLLRLEHAVARALAQVGSVADGLQAGLRAICDIEGWDYGRCFRVDPASDDITFEEGWFAREPATEQFLGRSRQAWQEGKPVWSKSPREPAGPFATFAFPAVAQGRTIGLLAFSGHRAAEPDEGLLEATQAIGSLFGQFLQRKQTEELLRDSEARFRSLTHLSSDFFWETDAEHRLSSIVHGPSYGSAQIGRGIIGKHPWGVASVSPDQAGWAAHMAVLNSRLPFRDFEFARVMPDGGTRYFSVSGEPRFDSTGAFIGYRGIGRDVTEIALARERIASLAYNDALTGLANRTSLGPALEQAIERTRRHRSKLAGVFIDLDGFKQVNDMHGHAAGDAFLVEVARRLRRSLRASDVVARLGGDEFFVVLEQMQDTAAVERVVSKLSTEMLRPYDLFGGVKARVSASLGVSLFPDDAGDAATLMAHADKAMYAAKRAGKNAYCIFSSGASVGPGSVPSAEKSDNRAA